MQISQDQKEQWRENPETAEYEAFIGPIYKQLDGTLEIESLFVFAEGNGLGDFRQQYAHLNVGQIAMNLRNRLRPLWRTGRLPKVTAE